jgi:PEGA domain-containing protein
MNRPQSPAGMMLTAFAVAGLLVQAVSASGQEHRRGGDAPSASPAPAASTPPAPPPPSSPPPQVDRAAQPPQTSGDNPGHRRANTPAETAVPRASAPRPADGLVRSGAGFYPWGFASGGGAVIGGYYDGYFGAYDPWYGWFPAYGPSYSTVSGYDGALRLKVKPVEATVYVDGYYVGVVDDFDGIFQRLRLDAGPHHIEIRASRYETLTFDVRIAPDETTTYRGKLVRQP